MDKLDSDDARPPYQQVGDSLRAAIAKGTYQPGQQLPSHKEVARQFGVSVGTAKRAFVMLQSERWIVTRQGQGSYVHTQAPEEPSAVDGIPAFDALFDKLAAIERRLESVEEELRGH